ncbi:hypothetical protein [Microbispora bryophytorum]|uniref:Uncharacterized protein n=1 Tax=Microbispora bryophytorum subsp. camponoti TaxID=1677852 RepID=A0ABR8KWW3_9ACTN|nr:hypothetical protein [Microbispora camponoti]MBD3143264.1 hypothetical protein [Microbispora camponoti]
MSKRVILTLASTTVLAAVVPGFAGFVTAQYEALDRARAELSRLQTKLQMMELRVEPAADLRCRADTSGQRQPSLIDEDDTRELTIPPRTRTRSWQNTAYVRSTAPGLWPSIGVPHAVPGPQAPGDLRHPHE